MQSVATQDLEGTKGEADKMRWVKVLNVLFLETPQKTLSVKADLRGTLRSEQGWNVGLFTVSPIPQTEAGPSAWCLSSQLSGHQAGGRDTWAEPCCLL